MIAQVRNSTLDRFQPWLIGAGMLVVYYALRQANLTYDGAAFITWFSNYPDVHPQHPLFGYYFHLCMKLGEALRLTHAQVGNLQSALTAAAAVGLYYGWLRRLNISQSTATLFTFILAFAGTVLEIATTVELYGIALLTVMISLHAWLGELRKPNAPGALALFVSCWLIVMFHVGWALWVLVLYLSLAWSERAHRLRATGRIAEGAAIAMALVLWFILTNQFGARGMLYQKTFYSIYVPGSGNLFSLLKPFWTFFIGFVVNGGLLLFPAVAGAFRRRREMPGLFAAFVFGTLIFLVCFGFWPADRGEFYLPLALLWGCFAARAVEDYSRDKDFVLEFGLAAAIYAAAIFASIWIKQPHFVAFLFWIYAAASVRLGWRASGMRPDLEPQPRPWVYHLLFGLTLALYLPPAIAQLKPNADTIRLNVFKEIAPLDARLITAIPPCTPYAQTGHPSQSPLQFQSGTHDPHETRQFLAPWMNELRAGGPTIWMDEIAFSRRDKIFNWPGQPPIPYKDLSVRRIDFKNEVFYELTVPR
ncbi:hypothetical protein LLG95_13615 [bacterium]|nr:hypothetical protein [bacterium]